MSNWLHISPTTGRGSTQMTISADTNDTPNIRKAKIIVTAGTLSKTIEVVQYPTAGEITCTYVVKAGGFQLVNYDVGLSRVVVYADNGNSLSYSGNNIDVVRDYATLLGVQEGDIITAQFYTLNHAVYESIFNGGTIPVKTISFSDSIVGVSGGTTIGKPAMIAGLPELETVHFGYNMFNNYYGENLTYRYAIVEDCQKLSAFTGDNAFVQDSRTLSKDGKLLGVALYGIEEYVVPSNITGISQNCFCKDQVSTIQETIKSIVFPSSVTTWYGGEGDKHIGFYNRTSLTSVTMEDSLVSGLTTAMFYGCSSLQKVRVSSGLTSWNVEMFCGCSSLSSLTIPSSVTSVGVNGYWHYVFGHSSFSGCTALTSITCNAVTSPSSTTSTFQGIATGGTLYYPDGSDYTRWLSEDEYYLGYYLWNDGVDFMLENVSTYYLQYTPIASGSGYSQSVFITANKPDYQVTLSTQQDAIGTGVPWFVVSGTPNTGYTEFKVYPTSSAETQRNCWLQISYDGVIYATITVVQQGVASSVTSDASVVMKLLFDEQQQDATFLTTVEPIAAKVDGREVTLVPSTFQLRNGYGFVFPSGEHLVELYYNEGTTGLTLFSGEILKEFYIFKDVVSLDMYYGYVMHELTHLHLWSGFTGLTNDSGYYNFFGPTPKLSSFEGESPLISFDRRTIVWNNILCGFAPVGLTSYAFPNSITTVCNVFGVITNTGTSIPCSTSISALTFPNNVTSVTANLDGMTALKSFYLPDSVVTGRRWDNHGEHQFACTCVGCTSLTDAYLSSGLYNYNNDGFQNCTSLTSVTFGNTTEIYIWGALFKGCSSLPTLTLPKTKHIAQYLCADCVSLTSITLDSVVGEDTVSHAIGVGAFSGCTALTDIYFVGNSISNPSGAQVSAIASSAFYNVASNGTFHYKSAPNPGNIMRNDAYYLGYYNWTAVNDIPY